MEYNTIDLDLSGSREKISENLEIPENTSPYTFMKNVMNENIPHTLLTPEIPLLYPPPSFDIVDD